MGRRRSGGPPGTMDEAAWIALLHRSMPPLHRFVSRRVGGERGLAEDIAQETWLRALDAWSRGGVPADPGAWLATVAANLIRNHFRRRAPRTGVELDGWASPDGSLEDVDGAERREQSALRVQALQSALARLPPGQAELLTERYLDDLPTAEIAARRGLGERALEGRLRRARAALARHVDPSLLPDRDR